MTLIHGVTLGGVLQIMTSDTRHVHVVNHQGREFEYGFTDNISKIKRISPYCLFGGGGLDNNWELIQQDLEQSGAIYIKDFLKPFKQSVARLRKDAHKCYAPLDDDDNPTLIMMLGFNKNGTTALLYFASGGEVIYKETPMYEHNTYAIAPSDDEWEAVKKTVGFNNPGVVDGYMEACLEYLAHIQKALHLNDAEKVSEIFCYTVLFKDLATGEFKCFEGQENLIKD